MNMAEERSPREPVHISVLMGGPSGEHDISLKSGHGVVEALTRRGWLVQPLTIPKPLTTARACQWTRRALEHDTPTVVFIALHGPFGEDGTVQQVCEDLQLEYTGSDVIASHLGLDKVASRKRFEQAGLAVPRWRLIKPASRSARAGALQQVGLPLVVKPTNQGSSLGVSIVARQEDLDEAVEQAAQYDDRILVEAFIRGREVTVGILGDLALPVVEIQSSHEFFDFAAKYTPGLTRYLVPAPLEAALATQIQAAGRTAHEAVGCRDFSRVDLRLDEANRPVVLEVNTIPGLTATSLLPKAAACVGISYEDLCERVVRMALARSAHRALPAVVPVSAL